MCSVQHLARSSSARLSARRQHAAWGQPLGSSNAANELIAQQGEQARWEYLTAANPTENPYCNCELQM